MFSEHVWGFVSVFLSVSVVLFLLIRFFFSDRSVAALKGFQYLGQDEQRFAVISRHLRLQVVNH